MWNWLIVLVLGLHCSNALYFHIAETERKCFIEEIPDETTVIGEFEVKGGVVLRDFLNFSLGFS